MRKSARRPIFRKRQFPTLDRLESRRLLTTIELAASADNTLFESESGDTSNGAGEFLFAGRTIQNADSLRRGLVRFDLSSIPPNSTVDRVELTLNMSRTIAGSTDVGLHRVLADWGEGTSDAARDEGRGIDATQGDATWLHSKFSRYTLVNARRRFCN